MSTELPTVCSLRSPLDDDATHTAHQSIEGGTRGGRGRHGGCPRVRSHHHLAVAGRWIPAERLAPGWALLPGSAGRGSHHPSAGDAPTAGGRCVGHLPVRFRALERRLRFVGRGARNRVGRNEPDGDLRVRLLTVRAPFMAAEDDRLRSVGVRPRLGRRGRTFVLQRHGRQPSGSVRVRPAGCPDRVSKRERWRLRRCTMAGSIPCSPAREPSAASRAHSRGGGRHGRAIAPCPEQSVTRCRSAGRGGLSDPHSGASAGRRGNRAACDRRGLRRSYHGRRVPPRSLRPRRDSEGSGDPFRDRPHRAVPLLRRRASWGSRPSAGASSQDDALCASSPALGCTRRPRRPSRSRSSRTDIRSGMPPRPGAGSGQTRRTTTTNLTSWQASEVRDTTSGE